MMSKYHYLTEIFNNELGVNYNLVFHNDESIEWKDILVDNIIHGVMHVTSGTFQKINGLTFNNQQIGLNFMIPSQLDIFSAALQNIEMTFKKLHNSVYEYEGEQIRIAFNYMSDSTKTLVNGVDYASVFVYLNLFSFENALMGNEATVSVDGINISGLIKAAFNNIHTSDGFVKQSSPIQHNRVNGIQKTLTINCVMVKNDAVLLKLYQDEDNDVTYNVVYNNGIKVRTNQMYLIQLTEDLVINDTAKIQITFGIK